MARNNSTAYKPKSLTKIIDQNALEFLALWRDLLGIALQARNLKQNLKKNL